MENLLLQHLKAQVSQLPVSDRSELVIAIIQSLQSESRLNGWPLPLSVYRDLREQALPASVVWMMMNVVVQSLQDASNPGDWQFLVARPHPWRKQLYVKGRKLLASIVWQDMISNDMTPAEAADNWELPLAVIQEIVQYCETHQDLLKLEAEEERYRLREQEVSIGPIPTS